MSLKGAVAEFRELPGLLTGEAFGRVVAAP